MNSASALSGAAISNKITAVGLQRDKIVNWFGLTGTPNGSGSAGIMQAGRADSIADLETKRSNVGCKNSGTFDIGTRSQNLGKNAFHVYHACPTNSNDSLIISSNITLRSCIHRRFKSVCRCEIVAIHSADDVLIS